MTYLPPDLIRAEDPLAYFTAPMVPAAVAKHISRPMPALDQMYAYYKPPLSDRRG